MIWTQRKPLLYTEGKGYLKLEILCTSLPHTRSRLIIILRPSLCARNCDFGTKFGQLIIALREQEGLWWAIKLSCKQDLSVAPQKISACGCMAGCLIS